MNTTEKDDFFAKMEEMAPLFLGSMGLPYDFTPESLDVMEDIIIHMFPNKANFSTTYIPFGYYLGEVLIHNIPNTIWDLDKEVDSVFDLSIKANGSIVAFPFKRIANFFEDNSDGISVFYRMVEKVASGEFEPDIDAAGEWQEFSNGDKVRFRVATKEEGKNYFKD